MNHQITPPDVTTAKQAPNAGLDQLEGIAAAADMGTAQVENPGADLPGQTPPGPDYGTEAAAMVDMIAALVTGYEPKTAPHWGDQRKAGIVAALVPVMQKYNFTMGNIPVELTLLVMAGPPLYMSMKIIAEEMKIRAAREVKEAKPAQDVDGTTQGGQHSAEMMGL